MATSSTFRIVHPDVHLSHEVSRPTSGSRLRRLFRTRSRRRRTTVAGWRDDAAFRAITRMGA